MWTIELWHASGRNTGSTGENPVGEEGEGGFLVRVQHPRSFASALLSFSAPSSDPEISLPLSIRTGCREREKEREEERKKESPNSKYDDYLQKSAFDEYTERHTLCNRA